MRGSHIDKTISGNIGIITPSAEGGYVGHIQEVPGCITQGETVAECRAMLKDALRGWVEVAMNPWISVEDELPEDGQRVVIFDGKDIIDGVNYWADDGIFQNDCDQEWTESEITHWMRLSVPPKQEAS